MLKLVSVTFMINLLMFSGCHSGQHLKGDNQQISEISLNGKIMDLTNEEKLEITNTVISSFQTCNDYYELLVTEDLLKSIREKEQYLEISLIETKTLNTEKFGQMVVGKFLIPLSGQYADDDQLTFFSGKMDFSNTPLLNNKGLSKLKELIKM